MSFSNLFKLFRAVRLLMAIALLCLSITRVVYVSTVLRCADYPEEKDLSNVLYTKNSITYDNDGRRSGLDPGVTPQLKTTSRGAREHFEHNRRFWDILFEKAGRPFLWEMFAVRVIPPADSNSSVQAREP